MHTPQWRTECLAPSAIFTFSPPLHLTNSPFISKRFTPPIRKTKSTSNKPLSAFGKSAPTPHFLICRPKKSVRKSREKSLFPNISKTTSYKRQKYMACIFHDKPCVFFDVRKGVRKTPISWFVFHYFCSQFREICFRFPGQPCTPGTRYFQTVYHIFTIIYIFVIG